MTKSEYCLLCINLYILILVFYFSISNFIITGLSNEQHKHNVFLFYFRVDECKEDASAT